MLKKIFASVIAILLVVSVFPFAVFAESTEVKSGTTGDCTWTLNGTVLTISGNGKMGNYYYFNNKAPWGKNITEVVIKDGVTGVGDYTFYDCTELTNIIIPDSVISIGNGVFSGCTGLKSITIPDNVKNIGGSAFMNCIELENIEIPDSVVSIGSHSFWECNKLTNITIPDTVSYIGDLAFYNCEKLTDIILPDGIKNIGNGTFRGCKGLTSIVIPDSVTSIGEYAFEGCKGLTSITIPYSVTNIGRMAFDDCDNLNEVNITDIIKWCNIDFYNAYSNPLYYAHNLYLNGETVKKIVIPENMTKIKNYIFYNCVSLTKVTIPNSVTSIGNYAFSGCRKLTSITIPSSITSISNGTFYDCTSLISIKMPDCIKSIGSYAFSRCMELTNVTIPESVTSMGESVFNNCRKLASVTISDGVTSIGNSAFSNCVALKSIIIPSSVKNIGDYAFSNCVALKSIIMPSSVKNIGDYAFNRCIELTNVTIYNGATRIGERAFRWCYKLTSINIPNSVTGLGDHAFYDCTALKEVHINDIAKWCSIDFYDACSNPLYYAHNLYLNGEAVKEIVIPETVTEISNYAFYNCTGLTKVTIPDSVTSIGYNTFTGCNDLVIETDSAYVYEYAISHGIAVIMDNSWIGSKKNPIVSVKAPDIKITENTNGTQMDGYYYYNNFYVKCIASYKDGEKEYNYAEIENGELEKQQTEHWTAGNTYNIKVKYGGIYTTVNVTVIENPIEKIDIRNVTLEDGFIEENLYDAEHPQCTVTLKDGTVTEAEDSGYNGFYVLIYDREYIKSLKAGDSYKVECEVAGIKSSYYVNIVSSPFKAIYIDDVVSEKSASGYYDYAPRSGIIELANGEKIKFSGTQVVYNGKYYSIGYDYQKQYDTPFTPGNTYEITATLGNLSTTYKVTAENGSQKEELEVNDVQLIKKPTKNEYMVGEVLDLRGAVIRLTFSDGSFEDIEITELPDDGYYYYNLFSKKLSTSFSLSTPYENWDYCISSTETSGIMLEAFSKSFECPVTAKENNWSVIKISDYYTATPKLTVTDKNGNVTVMNIKGLSSYGGSGGGDPWLYNSMGIPCVLYTDVGLFKADCFCWVDGNAEFFNVYINNKKLKSNNIYGDLLSFNNVNYDINGDGTVDIRDLIALKKRLAADKTTENKPVDTEDNKIFDSTDLAELRKIILLQ